MNTNMIEIQIKKSVDDAPNYRENGEGFQAASLMKAIVVRGGTEAGLDTVDLQFQDEKGNKYVAMTTGTILKSLAQVINIPNLPDEGQAVS